MYKFRMVGEGKFVVSVDNHMRIMDALEAFCKEQRVFAGTVTGIGAVNEATLRFLDPATKQYVDRTFREQMEISNLTGNISEKDGEPYLHVHVTLCKSDYTAVGGHLLNATLCGACELFIECFDMSLGRRFDDETGLNLYDI